jgi:hypothetical protein
MRKLCTTVLGLAFLLALIGDCAARSHHPKPKPQVKTSQLSEQQRPAQPSPTINPLTPEQITKSITDGIDAAAKQYEANHPAPPPDYSSWLFNLLLVVFTGGLVIVGAGQGFLIFWTLKVTQVAANAALKQATAAIGVELPILVPTDIALIQDVNPPKNVVGYPDATSFFRLRLNNLGRTAAELTTQSVEWRVTNRLPEIPVYASDFPFTPGFFIKPEPLNPVQILRFPINLQPDEVREIAEQTKSLWIYGRVMFKDFVGNPHEQRWCAKWQGYAPQPDGSLAAIGFVYDSATPPEYTKRT